MLFEPIQPMLLTMHKEPFTDNNYIFEPKYDGWRVLIHKDGERIEAFTRHGNRITHKLPELQTVKHNIHSRTAILDGEVVCIRDGRPNFDDFNHRGHLENLKRIETVAISHPAMFAVFDVLQTTAGGHTNEPLLDRKEILADLIEPSAHIAPTMFIRGNGESLYEVTRQQGWEGICAKYVGTSSGYKVGTRSKQWLKIKHWKSEDTVILGYRRTPSFALIVGRRSSAGLHRPVAVVEHGFRPEDKIAFHKVVPQLHTNQVKDIQWIEPRLFCRVKYIERTDNGNLRTVKFDGFVTSLN